MKKTLLWIGALVVGAILGLLGISWLNEVMNFVATVYTRLFQLLAVPTIVLAVISTFASFGSKGSDLYPAYYLRRCSCRGYSLCVDSSGKSAR